MHCQHDNGFSFVPANFSFLLLIIILQSCLATCRCNHSMASSSANKLLDLCTSLQFFNSAIFCKMMDSTFSISADLSACICSRKVSFTSDLFLGLIFSFRNVTLSSNTSCGLIINRDAKLQMEAYIMTSRGRGGGLLAQAGRPNQVLNLMIKRINPKFRTKQNFKTC
jgi:hypothetical protein